MTTEEQNTLAWMTGYRFRFEGKPRPAGPVKAAGWDAADRVLRTGDGGGGGYGVPVAEGGSDG